MGYIELISNVNLKKLLKRNYLTEETVMEIKTSFFIHPSTSEGDGLYSFNYAPYEDGNVIELFTSLDEYERSYGDNDDYVPLYWYFNQFEKSFDEDTKGILINPQSDNFFISDWASFLIMEDMDDVNRTVKLNTIKIDAGDLKDLKPKNDYLDLYLQNKSKITYIDRLFDILSDSVVYILYESEKSLDDYFNEDMISLRDVNSHYYKKDNHIMVFTDRNDLKNVMDSKYHYCYGVADLIAVIQTIFELDYDGFILKTTETEFELARHRLLKYWDRIVEKYRHHDIAADYAFRIVEDEK